MFDVFGVFKMFTVLINEKEYDIYSIDGKKHSEDKENWWIYFSDRLPVDLTPPSDSEYFKPWDSRIQRFSWEVKFKQTTTSRFKNDELRFSDNTFCEMWCNGKFIYKFETFGKSEGMSFAMSKANNLQLILREHSYNFLSPESMQGRKICYHGLPAKVDINSEEPWKMGIVPDYTDILDKENWWKEYRNRTYRFTSKDENWNYLVNDWITQYMEDDYINLVDILEDENIYWFRD